MGSPLRQAGYGRRVNPNANNFRGWGLRTLPRLRAAMALEWCSMWRFLRFELPDVDVVLRATAAGPSPLGHALKQPCVEKSQSERRDLTHVLSVLREVCSQT